MGADGTDAGFDAAVSFGRSLASLKDRGCTLLVVGTAPAAVHHRVCDRLLGEHSEETRRRLRVLAGEARRRHGPGRAAEGADGSAGHDRIIEHETARGTPRPAPSSAGPGDRRQGPRRTEGLVALGTAIAESIEAADRRAGELAPAELRVCVDALDALLEAHDRRTVFRFLHLVNGRVRRVGGVGHCHLRADPAATTTRVLAPLFEVVVELRRGDEGPEQRWRVRDDGACSGWLEA